MPKVKKTVEETEVVTTSHEAESEESSSSEAESEPVNGLVKIVKLDGKFYTTPQLEKTKPGEIIITQDLTQDQAEDLISRLKIRK